MLTARREHPPAVWSSGASPGSPVTRIDDEQLAGPCHRRELIGGRSGEREFVEASGAQEGTTEVSGGEAGMRAAGRR
jgi:hypothetical protein